MGIDGRQCMYWQVSTRMSGEGRRMAMCWEQIRGWLFKGLPTLACTASWKMVGGMNEIGKADWGKGCINNKINRCQWFVTYHANLPLLGSPFEFIPTSLHVITGLASPGVVWAATSSLSHLSLCRHRSGQSWCRLGCDVITAALQVCSRCSPRWA
jgi:hypothetical protein